MKLDTFKESMFFVKNCDTEQKITLRLFQNGRSLHLFSDRFVTSDTKAILYIYMFIIYPFIYRIYVCKTAELEIN